MEAITRSDVQVILTEISRPVVLFYTRFYFIKNKTEMVGKE